MNESLRWSGEEWGHGTSCFLVYAGR